MKLIDRYLAALVAGDPAAVPLTPEIRTVENLRQIRHGCAQLLELAAPGAAAAYLAHMVLRQVEWSLRHYLGAPATQRHLRLARLVVDDFPEGRNG